MTIKHTPWALLSGPARDIHQNRRTPRGYLDLALDTPISQPSEPSQTRAFWVARYAPNTPIIVEKKVPRYCSPTPCGSIGDLHRRLHLLLLLTTEYVINQAVPERPQHTASVLLSLVLRRPAAPVVVGEAQLHAVGAHTLNLREHRHGGHTRGVGGHDDNLGLSERRVLSLRRVQGPVVRDRIVREQGDTDVREMVSGRGRVQRLKGGEEGEVNGGGVGWGVGGGRGMEGRHQGNGPGWIRGRLSGGTVGCGHGSLNVGSGAVSIAYRT